MRYNPKDAITALPPGPYEAILQKCDESLSKKGNEMMTLTWKIIAGPNKSREVKDYIVSPATIYKLRNLARAMGKMVEFENASFQPGEFIGCHVTVDLGIEHSQGFDEKNVIGAYIVPEVGDQMMAQNQARLQPSNLSQPPHAPEESFAPPQDARYGLPAGVGEDGDIPF